MERRRRSAERVIDAVLRVDDAGDDGDRSLHLGAELVEKVGVVGEELHLDRLGRVRKVADHVFQHLRILHVQNWHLFLHAAADVADNFVDGTLAIRLQLHRVVAIVRFGYRHQTELKPGTLGRDLHFRRVLQDLVDLVEDGLRCFKRTSGGHGAVHDERAFIHTRQQVGPQMTVGQVTGREQHRSDDRDTPGLFDRPRQCPVVNAEDARHHWAGVVLMLVSSAGRLGTQQGDRERRGECERKHQRRKQRCRHGERKRAEERAGDAGDGDQRKEHDHRSDGGAD